MDRHLAPELYGVVKHGLCPRAVTVCRDAARRAKSSRDAPGELGRRVGLRVP